MRYLLYSRRPCTSCAKKGCPCVERPCQTCLQEGTTDGDCNHRRRSRGLMPDTVKGMFTIHLGLRAPYNIFLCRHDKSDRAFSSESPRAFPSSTISRPRFEPSSSTMGAICPRASFSPASSDVPHLDTPTPILFPASTIARPFNSITLPNDA